MSTLLSDARDISKEELKDILFRRKYNQTTTEEEYFFLMKNDLITGDGYLTQKAETYLEYNNEFSLRN